MLPLALPANGNLDRNSLPLVSHFTVLSAIHCSTGFTLDTAEGYLSYIKHCLSFQCTSCFVCPVPWRRWEG